MCERYFTYGLSTHGGMAEQITVPAAMCVAVPDGCDDANAVLAQPVAIAMHAVEERGNLRAGLFAQLHPEHVERVVLSAFGIAIGIHPHGPGSRWEKIDQINQKPTISAATNGQMPGEG